MRPQQIKFEVTEHAFLDVDKMTPIILAFRQAGYEVAFDCGTHHRAGAQPGVKNDR